MTGRLLLVAFIAAAAWLWTSQIGAGAQDTASVDLQAIIDEARPGEVITLEAGTYAGPVVIDKPISLVGEDGAVVDGGGLGHVISVEASDVSIENLLIRDSGARLDEEHAGLSADDSDRLRVVDNVFDEVLFGMFIRRSDDVLVSGNTIGAKDVFVARRGDGIRLWEGTGAVVENNRVANGRDSVFWFTEQITVRDNHVSEGRYGLHFMYAHDAVVERNVLDGNSVGAFLMYSNDLTVQNNVIYNNRGPSGYGLGLKDMDGAVVEGNRIEDNRIGLYVDNSPTRVDGDQTIHNNVFAFNDTGVMLRPSVRRNTFVENAFLDNAEQVAIDGGGQLGDNAWSSEGVGNHWSDFAGYDADGDGIGDIAYELDDLFSDLTDRHPELTFFTGTPAARAVDMAGRAFPNLRPDPKLIDESPLVAVPDFPEAPTVDDETSRSMLALTSFALLVIAALVVVGARPSRAARTLGGLQ